MLVVEYVIYENFIPSNKFTLNIRAEHTSILKILYTMGVNPRAAAQIWANDQSFLGLLGLK